MKENLPPNVCLNGNAVRQIREDKKLTQLYVAKVVGVTTDTISRWENNRYPSIKRENALKLAEALEVPVGEVLERETEEAPVVDTPEVPRRSSKHFLPLLLLLILAAVAYVSFFRSAPPALGLAAVRELPVFAAPANVIPVRVHLEIKGEAPKGFILREHFPPGWKLVESVPPASSLDNESGTARWILKPEDGHRLIAYLIKVAPTAELGKTGQFSGELVANTKGRNTPTDVGGMRQIKVASFQWADLNGDNVIDDAEMLQASDTLDQMKGVHLSWETLEEIWDAGSYAWDADKERFVPKRREETGPLK